MPSTSSVVAASLALCSLLVDAPTIAEAGQAADWRAFDAGHRIFSSGYIDQPYVVVLDDGAWLCTFTTGTGKEGQGGQHIVATRSRDYGRTWSAPVDIEPADGPAASWAMPYLTRYGRVYVFYNYNGDRVDSLKGRAIRNDTIGWYCFKYTDDGGRNWSPRFRLPLRSTACDRGNDWQGKVQIFWGIDKADHVGDGMMFGFTKLGKFMLDYGEGWFFRCDNINMEKDAAQLNWRTLPEGEYGMRKEEFGSVQEEHNFVPLGDGSLYCVYRTCLGHPAESYSRDGGGTWSEPTLMRYADGTLIKTPRACPRLFRCRNGKYLFWFHNHSGKGFEDRNPVWLAGGLERDGRILWSQPEILIYSHDTSRATGRFSYPDLIEQEGRYWTTCTNKETGRVHEIPVDLLEGLWSQLEGRASPAPRRSAEGCTIDTTADKGGFTLDMTLRLNRRAPGQALFDGRDASGQGVFVGTTGKAQLEIVLSAGGKESRWTTDPGRLTSGQTHRVTAIVDNGPKIICWVADGRICDGGESRQFGWKRYDRELGQISVTASAALKSKTLVRLRLFDRPLRISEVVSRHREFK